MLEFGGKVAFTRAMLDGKVLRVVVVPGPGWHATLIAKNKQEIICVICEAIFLIFVIFCSFFESVFSSIMLCYWRENIKSCAKPLLE